MVSDRRSTRRSSTNNHVSYRHQAAGNTPPNLPRFCISSIRVSYAGILRTRADKERGQYSLYDHRTRHGLQSLSDRRSSQETWFLRKKRVAAHRATEAGWRCLAVIGACILLGICRTDMNSTSGEMNDRCPNFVIIGVEVCVVSYATFDIPVFINPQRTRISCDDACGRTAGDRRRM